MNNNATSSASSFDKASHFVGRVKGSTERERRRRETSESQEEKERGRREKERGRKRETWITRDRR